MSKHIENEYKKIPDALYHYTSRKGFLGIIKTKQIWASHIRFMNDLKEQILALEILERKEKQWLLLKLTKRKTTLLLVIFI